MSDNSDFVETLPVETWGEPLQREWKERAITALEAGKVLLFPHLPFTIEAGEKQFLAQDLTGTARKNISFDPAKRKLSNVELEPAGMVGLAAMMERYSNQTLSLLRALLPPYADRLERARTSFRPSEIAGRTTSPRHDDKRLHVDAFPSRPLGGRRILRFFANVAADGVARHWRVGEPFPSFAQKFMPRVKPPLPGSQWLLKQIGVTKEQRSLYDHYMLGLHDQGKLDDAYQTQASKADLYFEPGATWLCFTDQVLHAALSGHGALEQTFHLPVEAMVNPSTSPLKVLETLSHRELA